MLPRTAYKWTLHDFNLYFACCIALYKNKPVYVDSAKDVGDSEDIVEYVNIRPINEDFLYGNGEVVPFADLQFNKPKGITITYKGLVGYISFIPSTSYKKGVSFEDYKINLISPVSAQTLDKAYCLKLSEDLNQRNYLSLLSALFERKRKLDKTVYQKFLNKEVFGFCLDNNYYISLTPKGVLLFFKNRTVGEIINNTLKVNYESNKLKYFSSVLNLDLKINGQ